MFKQKTYTGVKTGYSTTKENISIPGVTTVLSVNVFFHHLFNEILETFLKNECKFSDCRYDSESKHFYINGIPFVFTGSALSTFGCIVNCYVPFSSSLFWPSTANANHASFLYNQNTGEYSITFRYVGDPESVSYLEVLSWIRYGSNTTTGTALTVPVVVGTGLVVAHGRDLFRDRDFVAILNAFSTTTLPNYYEIEDGNVVQIKNAGFTGVPYISMSNEHEEFPEKMFLKQKQFVYLLFDNLFYWISYFGLPTGVAITSDSQTFVTINNELYWVTQSAGTNGNYALSGLVKCPTS